MKVSFREHTPNTPLFCYKSLLCDRKALGTVRSFETQYYPDGPSQGHLRLYFKLVTNFIVVYIMYILSEIYKLLLSPIPVMGPLW